MSTPTIARPTDDVTVELGPPQAGHGGGNGFGGGGDDEWFGRGGGGGGGGGDGRSESAGEGNAVWGLLAGLVVFIVLTGVNPTFGLVVLVAGVVAVGVGTAVRQRRDA